MQKNITGKYRWLFTPQVDRSDLSSRPLLSTHERWKKVAVLMKISRAGCLRLDWIIYRYQGHTVALTCRHFGIAPKTFHKWYKLFDSDNLETLHLLDDRKRTPLRKRRRMITSLEEQRIVQIRKEHMKYGKEKIAHIYHTQYGTTISSWKVQYTIKKFNLYPKPLKNKKLQAKRLAVRPKKQRTIDLRRTQTRQTLLCLDTVQICWHAKTRYVFTAVDSFGKVAYARIYSTKSSTAGAEFLRRLYYLCNSRITQIAHDNGSEFAGAFAKTCAELKIQQYYSRVRTPKDNAENERFNRTLQEEWLELKGMHPDLEKANQELTEWLIEYNFRRPHQTLNYLNPMEFSKVLPMYSSST